MLNKSKNQMGVGIQGLSNMRRLEPKWLSCWGYDTHNYWTPHFIPMRG